MSSAIGAQSHSEVVAPLAGKPAPKDMLIEWPSSTAIILIARPDLSDPNQMVSFRNQRTTEARRCTAPSPEAHILAITQAICEYRKSAGTDGPLYMGKDTHAVSDPAQRNSARSSSPPTTSRQSFSGDNGVTPTPVISQAILVYNPRPQTAPRGRHPSSRRRTTRLKMADSSTTNQRRPGRH